MSAARQWLMGRPEAASVLLGLPCVEVRSSGEGRGLGLFCTRDLPAFTRILSDPPLVLLKPTDDLPQLYERFQSLPEEARQRYLSLSYDKHDHNRNIMLRDKLLKRGFSDGLTEMVNVASIMQTNAFNVSQGSLSVNDFISASFLQRPYQYLTEHSQKVASVTL